MEASQLKETVRVLGNNTPAVMAIQRRLIQDPMERAIPSPTAEGAARGVRFSPAKFVMTGPTVEKMIASGMTSKAIVEVGQVMKILERVADKSMTGSPTAPFLLAWDAIKGVFTLNPVTAARSAAVILAPRTIARSVLTSQGRDALRTIATATNKGKVTKKLVGAMQYMGVVMGREAATANDDVRPFPPNTPVEQ